MARKILLDSNILIAAFRKNEDVVRFLNNQSFSFYLSDITIMELFSGCKTVQRRKEFEQILKFFGRAPIKSAVSNTAISLIKRYSARDVSIHLPDILIAATAINYNLPIKSLNKKDFDFIQEIELI